MTPDVAPIVTPEAPIVAQLVPVEQVIQPAAPVEAVRYQDIAGDIQKIADKVARDTRIASGMYGPSGDL